MSGLLLNTYKGHSGDVLDAHSSQDNSKLMSGGADSKAFLWDVVSGKIIRKFISNRGSINAVRINKDDSLAITGSKDTLVKIYDIRASTRDPIMVILS